MATIDPFRNSTFMRTLGGALLGGLLLASAAAHEVIITDGAPPAIGPYSQGMLVGDVLHVSGQIAVDSTDGRVVGDVELQTQRVLEQIQAIVEAAGMTLADVVATTVYLADLEEFSRMNSIYARHFPDPAPARSTVEVARLPRDARIEVSAVAVRRSGSVLPQEMR